MQSERREVQIYVLSDVHEFFFCGHVVVRGDHQTLHYLRSSANVQPLVYGHGNVDKT